MSDEKDPQHPPSTDPAAPARPDRVGRRAPDDEHRARDAAPRYLKDNDTPLALAWRVISSRYRSMRDKASRDFMRRTLRICLLYTSPSPRDATLSRMPSSA